MNITECFTKKNTQKDTLKSKYNIAKKYKIIIAVSFENNDICENILEWLTFLPAYFMILGKAEKQEIQSENIFYIDASTLDSEIFAFDAILTDGNNIDLKAYMHAWITPIIYTQNYFKSLLQEFSPSRGEGNAYMYTEINIWSIYYALTRYLENHNFPYDNRNLVKNVLQI